MITNFTLSSFILGRDNWRTPSPDTEKKNNKSENDYKRISERKTAARVKEWFNKMSVCWNIELRQENPSLQEIN